MFRLLKIRPSLRRFLLENRNTHDVYTDTTHYLRGKIGFLCNNDHCRGLYCVNHRAELPRKCMYCGVE